MAVKIFLMIVMCELVIGQQNTGYPAGFMAECPGMNRSTTFSEATKASLSVVVMKPPAQGLLSSLLWSNEKRCSLSKEGAACAAKFLDLKGNKLQVLISGYMDASFSPLVRTISAAYLARGRNLVVLEIFPVLVRTYPVAARATKPLGDLLGVFLAELTLQHGLSPGHVELVGGSLGAHIASFASVNYRKLTGRKPARLTGLDPAGPCFRNLAPAQRFHPDAAERTDALHTNIDGFGIADAVAQVDFYANGGEFQPSMAGSFLLPCLVVCSHVRAAAYWLLAGAHPARFPAVRCPTVARARTGDCYPRAGARAMTNLLGPKTNFTRPGIYYLPTAAAPPYYVTDATAPRAYGANNYLLKSAPDKDMVL